MFKKITIAILCMFCFTSNASVSSMDELILREFNDFKIYYNCEMRGFEIFSYITVPDTGNFERYSPFHKDLGLPQHCMQYKTSTYKSNPDNEYKYDRGHGVHQNICDHSKECMKNSNLFSNIVPHESSQNRNGLWRYAEKITECYRDLNDIFVVGGNIWGSDTSNDHFVDSHGVITPDTLFKILVIARKDKRDLVYAWMFPNNDIANRKNADDYLVTIKDIEKSLGYEISIIDNIYKNVLANSTPNLPKGCSIK